MEEAEGSGPGIGLTRNDIVPGSVVFRSLDSGDC